MSTEAQKRASAKWMKEHLRRIPLDVTNEYYTDVLLPFVKSHGYTMRGFILESIERNMNFLKESEGDK